MESVEKAKQLGLDVLGENYRGAYNSNEVKKYAHELQQYTPETFRKFQIQILEIIRVQTERLWQEAQTLKIPVKREQIETSLATALFVGCYPAVAQGIKGLQTCLQQRGLSNTRVQEIAVWIRDMGFLQGPKDKTDHKEQKTRDAVSHLPEKVDTIQDRFVISKKLGAGTFGAVYLAQDKKTERIVALKQLYPGFHLADVQAEIDLLNYIQRTYPEHTCPPFLACYLGFFVDKKGQYFLSMEYAPGVNLRQYLNQAVRFMETQPKYAKDVVQQIKFVVRQILQHLAALDHLGITQLDFNEGNVLVRRDAKSGPHVTLIDYGALCSNTHDRMCTTKMACTYCAPEQVAPRQNQSTKGSNLVNIQKVPIFALGALLYDVLQGSKLWSVDPRTERDKAAQLISTGMLYGKDAKTWKAPPFSWPYDRALTAMVNAMLIADPQKRPSAAQLIQFLEKPR